MQILQNHIATSPRLPMANSRFTAEHSTLTSFSYQISSVEARASTWTKNRFAPLPNEPEDAKLTGVTRSLNRRLLGLNVNGSLMSGTLVSA